MEQIRKTNKCCATCAYWLGDRCLNRLGFVEVESGMVQGKCGARNLAEHRTYQACYSCKGYTKWIQL